MTTALLVAFLISGSLSFASSNASDTGPADVVEDNLTDLYLEPGTYTPDEEGNINMTLIHRQGGNGEDMPDDYKYNMPKEEYDKLSDHDKEVLEKRRVIIKNVVNKDKMTGDVTSTTLTITNGDNRLFGDSNLTVELKEDTVDTVHLKENAVTESKLATDSVTEGKIKDNAVTSSKLATDSVTTAKILDKNVTTEKLADGAVTTEKLGASSVTEEKIQDGAISKDKLNTALKNEIDGKVNLNGENIDAESKKKLTVKLTEGADVLTTPTNTIVTDTIVKSGLDKKVDIESVKGNITSKTLIIKNGEKRLIGDSDLEIEIKESSITKEKLSQPLKTKIDEIDNKADTNATNISIPNYVRALSRGASIENPNEMLVKDSEVKKYLDLNYYTKLEVDRISSKSDVALSGVANAVAMANLPQVSSYNDYRHMVSASYGNYAGQSAISVGLSGLTENNRVTYKLSGALNTKGELALGLGIGVMIGKAKTPTVEMPTSIKDKLAKSENERKEMQQKLLEQSNQINDLYNIIKELKQELKKR
ncbi:YadA-like family protein [Pseudostreptobacillus hongkongensis]